MKSFSILAITFFVLLLFTKDIEAKTLPQAAKMGKSTAVSKGVGGGGISVSPRLRGDRAALIVNFANLQNASSVSYLLTYRTSTQDEGAMGSITLSGSTATQELLFGTCSRNVCRYHSGISNMKLEVSYTTKAGKKYLKRYKIKI